MKRIAAIAVATLAISLGSLASAGAARADGGGPPATGDEGCGGGYVAPALPTHLRYQLKHWNQGSDADGGTLGLAAPRGWGFVRTPKGEGRFHNRSGSVLLSLRTTTEAATPAAHMADEVRALAGTSGLKILGQHTQVIGTAGQRWATLSYQYLSPMSEPRTVKVRWIALGTDAGSEAALVLTVAGRPLDGSGLDAMLSHVSPTVTLAG